MIGTNMLFFSVKVAKFFPKCGTNLMNSVFCSASVKMAISFLDPINFEHIKNRFKWNSTEPCHVPVFF